MSEELKKEWEREFDDFLFGLSIRSDYSSYIGSFHCAKIKEFINLLLAKQQEEFVKILESKRPDVCNCVGGEYNCEHWGKHELIDDLLADIKSKIKCK